MKRINPLYTGAHVRATLNNTKSILVVGRRWQNQHTAEIFIGGKFIYHTPIAYGRDDQYICTAKSALIALGIDTDGYALRYWCHDNDIRFETTCANVRLRRDL